MSLTSSWEFDVLVHIMFKYLKLRVSKCDLVDLSFMLSSCAFTFPVHPVSGVEAHP